jgi:outer membrane biosynthesis protein TonB
LSSAVQLTQAVTSGEAKAVSAALANGADVDERNNGGQTALILAVIFGHTHLVQLLVNAGANPRLRDNLGLDAIEWAKRRGLTEAIAIFGTPDQPIRQIRVEEALPITTETRIDTDEKSRKWLAGVKQRIQEQARKEVVETAPVVKPAPEPEPAPVPEPAPAPKSSSTRKRCPRCNTIYNSELLYYCAHHVVPLVDADEPIFASPPANSGTNTPLLWMFILVTVSIAAFTGYMITSQLSQVVIPDTPTATTQEQPQSFLKGTPVASGELAGKSVQLPAAECPVFENEPRPANTSYTVNVQIKIDKAGKVYWARAEGGDEPLRRAASEAASNSTFAPDKLRGRETQGTITYTFAQ